MSEPLQDLEQAWRPVKTIHPIKPINVMALIQSNRNISQLMRKTTDKHKRWLLTKILKANSKIIISL